MEPEDRPPLGCVVVFVVLVVVALFLIQATRSW